MSRHKIRRARRALFLMGRPWRIHAGNLQAVHRRGRIIRAARSDATIGTVGPVSAMGLKVSTARGADRLIENASGGVRGRTGSTDGGAGAFATFGVSFSDVKQYAQRVHSYHQL